MWARTVCLKTSCDSDTVVSALKTASSDVERVIETANGKHVAPGNTGLEGYAFDEADCIMENTVEFCAGQYAQRIPAPCVEAIYQAENAILFQHTPGVLRTHVVCPGVLYGNGESNTGFHDLFAKAWQADMTTALPVYGTGQNIIPTVHVEDCASFVMQLALSQPDLRYLMATDDSRMPQVDIVEGISRWFATGETFHSDPLSLFTQQVC